LPGDVVVPQQEIEVIRVTEKVISEDEEMPYQVEKTTDPTLEKGLTRTLVAGKNGLARNTLRVTYYNGQEAKRELLKIETLSQPRNRAEWLLTWHGHRNAAPTESQRRDQQFSNEVRKGGNTRPGCRRGAMIESRLYRGTATR
jgi:hypothetical protein